MPYRIASLRLFQIKKMDKENKDQMEAMKKQNRVPSRPRRGRF